jgi:hypothetical protein
VTATATDAANDTSLFAGPVAVSGGPVAVATRLRVTTQPPGSATAGSASGLAVTAVDARGDGVAAYAGTVHFTSSDPQAVLPADYAFTTADAGSHAFAVTLETAGPQTLTATDGTLRASATLSVAPAAATRLAVTTQPPAVIAPGAGFGLAVSAEDPFGNVATPFTGGVSITLAGNPGGAVLGSTLTVNAVNGVATFGAVTLDKAGSGYTLQASSSGLASATTNAFNVANIGLSGTSVYEFRPAGTVVGALTTVEPGSHTFTYSLASGTGSADNASFTISGNQLRTADAFDFAAKASYSVRVRSTDEANHAFEQTFTITILDDPALTRSGRTLTVRGTPGNDAFAFAADPVRHALTLNGISLAVDIAAVDTVVFQGGGSDSATLTGLPGGGNSLSLAPGGGSLSGPGYTLRLSGVSTLIAVGGPGDSASLTDSPGDDVLVATPSYAYLRGVGFYEQASGFPVVVALSSAGGRDAAYLYDSADNDSFVATPSYAYLDGQGFYNQASGFKTVVGNSSAGGSDSAELYDPGPGGSAFVGAPSYAYLSGGGTMQEATGFRWVLGIAAAGAGDTATLYDSAGNDSFVAAPGLAYLAGSGFLNQVNGFKTVVGVSSAGGQDTATLYGAASGSDTLVATPSYAYLSGGGFFSQASGFPTVVAVSQGGSDQAYLYGSAGNDVFVATAAYAYLRGAGFYTQASGFHSVYAYGQGGSDQAYLYGTGTSADTFGQGGSWAYLYGNAFLDMVNAFAYVYANPNARR